MNRSTFLQPMLAALLLSSAPLALAGDEPAPRFQLNAAKLSVKTQSADGRFRVDALRVAERQPDSDPSGRFTLRGTTPSKALCNPVPPPRIFGDGFENP